MGLVWRMRSALADWIEPMDPDVATVWKERRRVPTEVEAWLAEQIGSEPSGR